MPTSGSYRHTYSTQAMKKFLLAMAIIPAALCLLGVYGCGKDDEPDDPTQNPSLSTDITSLNLTSEKGASGTFQIRSNSDWEITGMETWLSLSSASGNGNATITVTSRSENNSAVSREVTLTITSGEMNVSVLVRQDPALVSCVVTPTNITTLYDAVIFDLSYTSDVATCKLLMVTDYDYKHKTNAEWIEEIEKEENQIPDD